MKISLVLSALVSVFAFGCGASQDSAQNTTEGTASLTSAPRTGPLSCTIQTANGRFLTAVGGGGRVTDVLHTDATRALAWEKFVLVDSGDGQSPINYGIMTKTGHYLTAVGGGGRITDVIHSNATQLLAWEKFALHSLGGGWYAIKTISGNWVTATGAGGQVVDAIHTDAVNVNTWEKFKFNCTNI